MRIQLQERVNELQEVRAAPPRPRRAPIPPQWSLAWASPGPSLSSPASPTGSTTHGAFSLTTGSPGG